MKIAAAYNNTIIGDIDHNINSTRDILLKLKDKSIDFTLFPELNISAYIKSQQNLDYFYKQQEATVKKLKNISSTLNIAFAVGYPQKIDGRNYISQVIYYKGDIIATHFKTHLGPLEREIYKSGYSLNVFNLAKLNTNKHIITESASKDFIIGMQICFESHFPELSYIQSEKGANLITFSYASPKETSLEKLQRFSRYLAARAYDNSVYVMCCNLSGKSENGHNLNGLAMIIDPKGNTIASSTLDDSGFCFTEIDQELLQHIYKSKMAYFNKHKRLDFIKQLYKDI